MKQVIHSSVHIDRIIDMLATDNNEGICVFCGESASGIEPDAREYKCASCGELGVYGAEELLVNKMYVG